MDQKSGRDLTSMPCNTFQEPLTLKLSECAEVLFLRKDLHKGNLFLFHIRMRVLNRWGALVNKQNNSFNGMIGMVQRQVG